MTIRLITPRAIRISLSVASLALMVVVVLCITHDDYQDALATFQVKRSTHSAEMLAVSNTVLSRAPVGSSSAEVISVLESLGFTRSLNRFDRRLAFVVDTTIRPRLLQIQAHRPYSDPCLDMDRFVCDRPALRLMFQFDSTGKLASLESTTARACI